MSYKFSAKGSSSNSNSVSIGNNIKNGLQMTQNRANSILKQQHDYSEALQNQREFEMKQEQHDHDTSKELVNMISTRYPLGDKKSDQEYEMFKQTEQYAELAKHIKKGAPWAVKDGEVQRIPAYKAAKSRLDYEHAALRERVENGSATQEDKIAYVKNKVFKDLHEKAVKIASDKEDFATLNPNEQTDQINQIQNVLFNSAVSSLGNTGAIPQAQADPAQVPGRALNPFVAALANQAGGGTPVGAMANIVTPQNPASEGLATPQGVTPVPTNQPKIPNYRIVK